MDLLSDERHLTCSKRELIIKIQAIFIFVELHDITKFIEEVYYSYFKNTYHNIQHAFEVLQMTHIITKLCHLKRKFSLHDLQLLYIVALCHDLHHEGYTNNDLSKSSCDSCESYDNIHDVISYTSINEYTHIKKTLSLIEKYNLIPLCCVNDKVNSLILSTDLQLHHYYIAKSKQNTSIYLNLILKLSDTSHFFRQFKIHCYWVHRIQYETKIRMDLHELCNDTLWFRTHFVDDVLNILCNQYEELNSLRYFYDDNISRWKDLLLT